MSASWDMVDIDGDSIEVDIDTDMKTEKEAVYIDFAGVSEYEDGALMLFDADKLQEFIEILLEAHHELVNG